MPTRLFRFGWASLLCAAAPAFAAVRLNEVDCYPIAGEPLTAPAVMPAHKERHHDVRSISRYVAICTLTTRRAARRARGRAKGTARLVTPSASR